MMDLSNALHQYLISTSPDKKGKVRLPGLNDRQRLDGWYTRAGPWA